MPAESRLFLLFYPGLLVLFFLSRVAFLVAYALPGLGRPEAIEAFARSLRLDLAAAALLLAPLLLLSLPLLARPRSPRAERLLASAAGAVFALSFALCVSNFVFFRERSKLLEEEFFLYWNRDILPALAAAWSAHPLLIVFSLAALAALFVLVRALSLGVLRSGARRRSGLPARLLFFLGTLALLFLLARGVGGRPLRSGQVLNAQNAMVNYVAVNPPYNILVDGLSSFLERGHYLFYDSRDAIETTRTLLQAGGETFGNARYPLLRTLRGERERRRRNVVVVQLEGFSNGFIGYRRGGREVTPFLNGLARRQTYFPNFIQNVRFTHRALFVINTGHPDRATPRTILKSPETRHGFSSLGRTLGAEGYDRIYVEGGSADYEDMRGFLRMQGYTVFDGADMDASGRYKAFEGGRDAFGYHDDLALTEAVRRFAQTRRPFLGYVMLHSTHSPWMPPLYFKSAFEKPFGVFEYTDWAVGRFFALLEEQGLLDETIVVLTADHTSLPVRDLSDFDRTNIPLIIYDKGLEGVARETVGSQVDILPTVLGLLGLEVPCAAMGRDLLRVPEEKGFACSLFNGYVFWYEAGWILKDWLDDSAPPELYERGNAAQGRRNLAPERPGLAEQLERRSRSYYQASRVLALEDRVFPGGLGPAGKEKLSER